MSNEPEPGEPKKYLASAHLQERREARREARIEIEVDGTDGSGNIFRERTFTRNISEWGCQFTVSTELEAGIIVVVQVLDTETGKPARQGMFQVMRVEREGDRLVVGAWKLDSGNIWGASIEEPGKSDESGPAARRRKNEEDEQLSRERRR